MIVVVSGGNVKVKLCTVVPAGGVVVKTAVSGGGVYVTILSVVCPGALEIIVVPS